MSSLNNNKPFESAVSEKQFNGYFVPNHNAKIIKAAIESGAAPFLPDQSGKITPKAIYNGNTGYCLNAKELIPLQIQQGGRSDVVATFSTVNKAGTKIKENEKGLFYNFRREDGTIGTAQFFFPEQTENAEAVRNAVKKNTAIKLNKNIEITSANPEEYLASYVAACKSGASVSVSPEIAEQFKQNFMPLLENQLTKYAERDKEMDSLGNFMFKVDQKANAINKELFAEVKKEHQKSQTDKKEQNMERRIDRSAAMSY